MVSSYFWTSDEVLFLRENYPSKGAKYCAQKLSRSLDSVNGKVKQQKLSVIYDYSVPPKTHKEHELKLLSIESPFYPLEEYKGCSTPILYSCINGHTRRSTSSNITQLVYKCSECCNQSKFDYEGKAVLYFVSFEHNDIVYYKIGITNKPDISKRFIGDWNKFSMKLLWFSEFNSGKEAKDIEKRIKTDNKAYLLDTGLLRNGNTETFSVFIEKDF